MKTFLTMAVVASLFGAMMAWAVLDPSPIVGIDCTQTGEGDLEPCP